LCSYRKLPRSAVRLAGETAFPSHITCNVVRSLCCAIDEQLAPVPAHFMAAADNAACGDVQHPDRAAICGTMKAS